MHCKFYLPILHCKCYLDMHCKCYLYCTVNATYLNMHCKCYLDMHCNHAGESLEQYNMQQKPYYSRLLPSLYLTKVVGQRRKKYATSAPPNSKLRRIIYNVLVNGKNDLNIPLRSPPGQSLAAGSWFNAHVFTPTYLPIS